MVEHPMSLLENPKRLAYTPGPDVNFQPVSIEIPIIRTFAERMQLLEKVGKAVTDSCGAEPCDSRTFIETGAVTTTDVKLEVKSARIRCTKAACPLREPPASDDNEPLAPAPTPPALEVHATSAHNAFI